MAKTVLGCQVLQDKGHFTEFAEFIRQHGLEEDDFDIINKLKSVLWAVVGSYFSYPHVPLIPHAKQGNIGATSGGLHFLEAEDIIPIVVEIAEQSLVLSVRG
jgi:rapamycin-insensitive companion of mTOR